MLRYVVLPYREIWRVFILMEDVGKICEWTSPALKDANDTGLCVAWFMRTRYAACGEV